jgi:hypothetical protein
MSFSGALLALLALLLERWADKVKITIAYVPIESVGESHGIAY